MTGSDIDTEHISIFFYYMGDDKDAPSAKFSIRWKKHKQPFEINCFGNNREWGIYHDDITLESCLLPHFEPWGASSASMQWQWSL